MNYEKRLREGGVTVYEADVRPPERYLMERFITSPVWVEVICAMALSLMPV